MTVEGTVFAAGKLRIMSIDGYPLETSPSGALLILKNSDRPGLIGEIGTVLGKAGINIARMNFGRKRMHGDAITVLNLDVTPEPDVVRQVRDISGIDAVHTVSLPSEER